METNINETGNIGMKDETRGNRDEQRGVRDVTEIGQTLEWKRYSGGRQSGTDLLEIHWGSISNNFAVDLLFLF